MEGMTLDLDMDDISKSFSTSEPIALEPIKESFEFDFGK